MSSRRNLFAVAGALTATGALAACDVFKDPSTLPATTAKVEAYIQGGVSTLQAYLLAFGGQMSSGMLTSATKALNDLTAAATAVGTAITSAAPMATTAGLVQKVGGFLQIAVEAVVVGLASISNPGAAVATAITIAKEVLTFLPVLNAFVNSVIPTVGGAHRVATPASAGHLGIMVI